LAGYPIAAIIVSTCAGTVLIGSCVWVQSHRPKHGTPHHETSAASS